MARLQQRQQVVEFQQVVLHGRGAQQEQVPPLQGVDQLPVLRRAVLAVMGFVDDHQVPRGFGDPRRPVCGSWQTPATRARGPCSASIPGGRPCRSRGGVENSRWNFDASSSRHCDTRGVGTRMSTRLASPRSRYSRSNRQASIVLPSPTSSANSTRPRKRRRTLRTVSIWWGRCSTPVSPSRQSNWSKSRSRWSCQYSRCSRREARFAGRESLRRRHVPEGDRDAGRGAEGSLTARLTFGNTGGRLSKASGHESVP